MLGFGEPQVRIEVAVRTTAAFFVFIHVILLLALLTGQLQLQVHDRFVASYGSVLCRDIRPRDGGCEDIVGKAAAWGAEVLLE